MSEMRIHLLTQLVQSCSNAYEENKKFAGVLDDKAQKTGALAGIFLAGVFAFIRAESLKNMNRYELGLLTACTILLLACSCFCLTVIWARDVARGITPAIQERIAKDLLQLDPSELTNELWEAHHWQQISLWKPTLEDQKRVNESKARYLKLGQLSLAVAMAGLTLMILFLIGIECRR
jgi:predicted PurR-regulated permease PerM